MEMKNKEYTFGKSTSSWKADSSQTVTFIVTNDCNLRCKYCYITHKSPDKRMDFETAKEFIDLLLTSDEMRYEEAVILEFIGGEPLIEVEIIDKICDYFKLTAFRLNHDWYWNYHISICTNGVNYSSPAVQKFIRKNYYKISVTISIDGTKEKHDMQRVFPDGSGSYDIISKSIDLWLSQFRGSTKVTFASQDLPLLYDSIISLWNRGIKNVSANVVFENVWNDGDDKILEQQLIKLADYVINNELYNKDFYCSFFDENIGFPYTEEDMERTYCGAGKMMAFASNGKIYPCVRYYGYSLNNHKEWPVGSKEDGIDMEKVRPFVLSTNRLQSDEECLNCDIASGCAFCQGFNYDEAPIPTNFHRAKYICKMHKATVRANDYYFSKLYNKYDIERNKNRKRNKNLCFLISDKYTTYCSYNNKSEDIKQMDKNTIIKGLKYARQNFLNPIFIHSRNTFEFQNIEEFQGYDILNIVPVKFYIKALEIGLKRVLPVYDIESLKEDKLLIENVILNINEGEIELLSESVDILLPYTNRINLNITGLDKNFNEEQYRLQMEKVKELLVDDFKNKGVLKEINLLTDILFIKKHDNCMAGENTFVLSPDGMLYTCSGEYSDNPDNYIGNLERGIFKEYGGRLHKIKNSNLCRICDALQCKNCVYINKKYTNEFNVSPSFQCRKSHIERDISVDLLEELNNLNCNILYLNPNYLEKVRYSDPVSEFLNNNGGFKGYYKYKK